MAPYVFYTLGGKKVKFKIISYQVPYHKENKLLEQNSLTKSKNLMNTNPIVGLFII